MKSFDGLFYDGLSPAPQPAQMVFEGDTATLTKDAVAEHFPTGQLWVSPRIGATSRFISMPNGGQFSLDDDLFLDALPQDSRSEGPVAWLEQRWWMALISVLVIAVALLIGYFKGLPYAADQLAVHVPMETEQQLGKRALDWFEQEMWLTASELDSTERETISKQFYRLIDDLPLKEYYRIEFRSSPYLGANALSLPGGIILITDDLVDLADHPDEVMAVLAHEIAHVELRHVIKGVLQQSALAIVVSTMTSDAATLSAAVAGLPIVVARLKYSRDFEAEADDHAFKLLQKHGYSPEDFATIIERLDTMRSGHRAFRYLSSHPLSEERAERARKAAADE